MVDTEPSTEGCWVAGSLSGITHEELNNSHKVAPLFLLVVGVGSVQEAIPLDGL